MLISFTLSNIEISLLSLAVFGVLWSVGMIRASYKIRIEELEKQLKEYKSAR